jgi:hypothetical protein
MPRNPEEESAMRSLVGGGVVATLALALVVVSAGGQEPKRPDVRPFMRQKLRHAQFLIEGLANEDLALIRDNARALRKIAGDAQWRVSPNLAYVKYGAEFAGIADELERRANEKDLNGATLSYIRLTINCVDCHRFVRDNRILDSRPRDE